MTSAARRTSSAAAGLWPPPQQAWIAFTGVGLIYVAHLLYGANVSTITLTLDIVAAALVAGALLTPALRADLLRLKGLPIAASLLAVVLAGLGQARRTRGAAGHRPIISRPTSGTKQKLVAPASRRRRCGGRP